MTKRKNCRTTNYNSKRINLCKNILLASSLLCSSDITKSVENHIYFIVSDFLVPGIFYHIFLHFFFAKALNLKLEIYLKMNADNHNLRAEAKNIPPSPPPSDFPFDVLKYLKQNVIKNSKIALKLMKVCKYLQHHKFHYLIVKGTTVVDRFTDTAEG